MSHLALGEKQKLTTYRKIAIASWRHPVDPSTYSWLDLPVGEAEAFLKAYSSETRPTLTHYIAKIVAHCLEQHPELNAVLRGNSLYRRARTDVFITTLLSTPLGKDLSGFQIPDATGHSLGEIAGLSAQAIDRLKKHEDADTNKTAELTAKMPVWLMRVALRFQHLFHYTLNISLRPLGLPDDRFGSVMISNFGVLGIDNALVPLSPYCRCPLIIGIGRTRPMPIVRDGQVVVADCVTISFTFDHRYADGVHGGMLLRAFQKIFLKPTRYKAVFDANTPADPAAAPKVGEEAE